MRALHDIRISTSVVLGEARLPIRELLALSRGSIITLEGGPDRSSELHANGTVVGSGTIVVQGDDIALELTRVGKGAR